MSEVIAEIHGFSQPGAEPTPWSSGLEFVVGAETFWLSTVRSDGRRNVTPLIAVWLDDAIWFTTGPDEVNARNVAENAACILTTGCADVADGVLDVVLEGAAEHLRQPADIELLAGAL